MTTSRLCPNCGHQQAATSPYCANCGSPMPGMGTGQLPANSSLSQGRYIVVRRVGKGGMGAVYQAADTRLGNKAVAIKEMSDLAIPNPQQKQQAIDAFRQEAQMLAHLDHPNLPKVTDYFTDNGKHYIVMEFVDGETLESYLQRQRVGEAQVRLWATQLFDVLSYLHRQNPPVIFRDLKPANVMLTPQGQIKLIDFGIARFFKAGKAGDTLNLGTPGYAAPEQHGAGQTDARSDVYSLGVVLHQALTGYDPSLTPFVLPPVHQFYPSVSPQMEQAVATATQTNPLQRFQSMDQFRQALAAGSTVPAAATTKITSTTPSQGPKIVIALVGAAVLGLLAYFGVQAVIKQGASTPTPPAAIAPAPVTTDAAAAAASMAGPTATPRARLADPTPVPPTDAPPPLATKTPVPPPTDTPVPPPTATAIPTETPIPEPQAVVNADDVNLRSGTGGDFAVIRKLYSGDTLRPVGRNQQGDWLQVRTANGDIGWISSQFVDLNLATSELATVATPALPPCAVAVDGQLASAASRSRLGCPTGQAAIVWTAWQPFERGAMLWRQATNRVSVFYDNGTSTELQDQWDQVSNAPSRGAAPTGRQAPVRGFGWIWGNRDEVFDGLGWAIDEEKGVCALLQLFEKGYVLRSTNVALCNGNYNRANDPGFSPIFRSVDNNGGWQSH